MNPDRRLAESQKLHTRTVGPTLLNFQSLHHKVRAGKLTFSDTNSQVSVLNPKP